jgi:quercetin dioxygenase-like cupin family protein
MKYLPHVLALLAWVSLSGHTAEYQESVEVKENLSSTTSWDGTPIQYPSGTAKVSGAIITMSPGAETGWHLHPVPCFALILEGELLVELKDGRTQKLKAGDTLAEVMNAPHNGKNTGKGHGISSRIPIGIHAFRIPFYLYLRLQKRDKA